eukprot:CAMPEP_0171667502 /NCGR_PEP_ID=MMETSP0990-20121206/48749_1 /TAXON_ID=483369 /ORGANISM="non described non described, Strain CCMP2098" /LENGTH=105 /DNA_ID=CAMNT_0012251247 /DNA_START=718 /DNA_END=1038 /DNA_ORIENTATION=+
MIEGAVLGSQTATNTKSRDITYMNDALKSALMAMLAVRHTTAELGARGICFGAVLKEFLEVGRKACGAAADNSRRRSIHLSQTEPICCNSLAHRLLRPKDVPPIS